MGTGHGDVSELDKAIRIHGNFSEYMPIALVLLGVLELGGLADTWLHVFGATLVVGRLLHAAGLSKTKGTSLPRLVGVLSTFYCVSDYGRYGLLSSLLANGYGQWVIFNCFCFFWH